MQNLHLTWYDESLNVHGNVNYTSSFVYWPITIGLTIFQPSVTAGSLDLPHGLTGYEVRVPMYLVVVFGWVLMIPKYILTKLDQVLHMQLLVLVSGSTCGHLWALQMWSATASLSFGDVWPRNLMGDSAECSSFTLLWLYEVVIGFHQTVCFWVKSP